MDDLSEKAEKLLKGLETQGETSASRWHRLGDAAFPLLVGGGLLIGSFYWGFVEMSFVPWSKRIMVMLAPVPVIVLAFWIGRRAMSVKARRQQNLLHPSVYITFTAFLAAWLLHAWTKPVLAEERDRLLMPALLTAMGVVASFVSVRRSIRTGKEESHTHAADGKKMNDA